MKRYLTWALLIVATGCAGTMRECSSGCAQSLGADWLVAQYRNDGQLMRCWKLPSVSVANEAHSDGIYWQDPRGHLVHISGWYNRVQVSGGDWDGAAASIGVKAADCK